MSAGEDCHLRSAAASASSSSSSSATLSQANGSATGINARFPTRAYDALWEEHEHLDGTFVGAPSNPRVDAMVFEGAGVLGYSYAGALRVAERFDVTSDVTMFAGSSSGSMTAAALACGGDADFIQRSLDELDFSSMIDPSFCPLANVHRLYTRAGWARGDRMSSRIGQMLDELTGDDNITLDGVKRRFGNRLVVAAFDCSTRAIAYFAPETHPYLSVRDAVHRSSSFPGLFPFVRDGSSAWWDGGVGDNYPIHVFDAPRDVDLSSAGTPPTIPSRVPSRRVPRSTTMGFKVVGDNDVQPPSVSSDPNGDAGAVGAQPPVSAALVNNGVDAARSALVAIWNLSRSAHEHMCDWKRTCKIRVGGLTALDVSLSEADKTWLLGQGEAAATTYLTL